MRAIIFIILKAKFVLVGIIVNMVITVIFLFFFMRYNDLRVGQISNTRYM